MRLTYLLPPYSDFCWSVAARTKTATASRPAAGHHRAAGRTLH